MWEKLLTRGSLYILLDFQKGHKLAKNGPPSIFFSSQIYSSMDKFLSFQEKKTNFFSVLQGSAREKTYKLLSISGFTLLIRENKYETAVTYMNPRCQ